MVYLKSKSKDLEDFIQGEVMGEFLSSCEKFPCDHYTKRYSQGLIPVCLVSKKKNLDIYFANTNNLFINIVDSFRNEDGLFDFSNTSQSPDNIIETLETCLDFIPIHIKEIIELGESRRLCLDGFGYHAGEFEEGFIEFYIKESPYSIQSNSIIN